MINGVHTLNVLVEVAEERHRQDEIWGVQDFPFHHPVDALGDGLVGIPYARWADSLKNACDARRALAKNGGPDRRSGLLVLLEEVAEAAAERHPLRIREELVQVAAVAVKLIEALDRADAAKHGAGCELGMWHGGECGPSALLREATRHAMTADHVPSTFRAGGFTSISRETVEATVQKLMADPYRVYSTGVFDESGPVPPLKPVPLAEAVSRLGMDLTDDQRRVLDSLPDATLELETEPIPVLEDAGPLETSTDWYGRLDTHFSGQHTYNGGDRLHGICRCGNGSDDPIHQCPDCGHGFHTVPCRELVMPGAPGDVDECGCRS